MFSSETPYGLNEDTNVSSPMNFFSGITVTGVIFFDTTIFNSFFRSLNLGCYHKVLRMM